LKVGHKDVAKETMMGMKDDILALPGLHSFSNIMTSDTEGYVISIVSDEDTSNGNTERVKELWGRMGEHLAEMPSPQGAEVMAHWDN
jgi:hypothetical protein